MLKKVLTAFTLSALLLFGGIAAHSIAQSSNKSGSAPNGTLEKMIVASGNAAMDLDLNRLNGAAAGKLQTLHFNVAANSYFSILVFNDVAGTGQGIDGSDATRFGQVARFVRQILAISCWNKTTLKRLTKSRSRTARPASPFLTFKGMATIMTRKPICSALPRAAPHLCRFRQATWTSHRCRRSLGKISTATTMAPIEIEKVVNGAVQSAVMPALCIAQCRDCPRPGCHRWRSSVDPPQGEPAGATSGWGLERLPAIRESWIWIGSNAKYRPSGHSAKSLSNERRSQQQRTLRTNWPILAQTCLHRIDRERLQPWL